MSRLAACVLVLALAVGCGKAPGSSPRGKVLFRNRYPVQMATVRVTGCADQTTSVDGSFDTSCAASTYDVAVRWFSVAFVYEGLTRRDPIVTLPGTLVLSNVGTVSGTVAGFTPGRALDVAVTSSEYAASCTTTDGMFDCLMEWSDGIPPQATVRALEWIPGVSGFPASFTGYGTAPVTPAEGMGTTAVALGAIANGSIFVNIDEQDVASLVALVFVTWPDGAATFMTRASPGTAGVTTATPDVPGASFTVLAWRDRNPGAWAWRRGLPATATPAPIVLPTAPVFSAPAPGATVDLSTDFTFGPLADSVYVVGFEPADFDGPSLFVVTRSTTVRLPDFSWAGLALPSAKTLVAWLSAIGPCASMDDATASSEPLSHLPGRWGVVDGGVPSADGFATRQVIDVTTP